MKRYDQTVEALLASLSTIEASWKDTHAESVTRAINAIPEKPTYGRSDLEYLLDRDFDAALTAVRLILEKSKDEWTIDLKSVLGRGGTGIKRYQSDREAYLAAIEQLGFIAALETIVSTPVSWRDLLIERLKTGRGSAIKGQARGRFLEDFTQGVVSRVFADIGFDTRCRFLGAQGTSTEKADFAIPSKEEARILIEAKAYGATGSKQTDILGDIARIAEQKRHDTDLILVTDGVTWQSRTNDLRKLVHLQNQGVIARIYTIRMEHEFEADLRQLRQDHAL